LVNFNAIKLTNMKKLLFIAFLCPIFLFSQNPMIKKEMNPIMKKKMEIKKKKNLDSKPFEMKKKVEKTIIDLWEEYSRAFEYSDFEKIKTYFIYPVTFSLLGDPVIVKNENDLIKLYNQIRSNVQEGYKYSKLEKSRIIWISKEICMVDATYSRFNENYERIFTGRGIYMYKRVDKSWKMFSMSGVKINNKK